MITEKQADAGATCATVLEHEAEVLRSKAARLEEMAAEIRRHFTGSAEPPVDGKLPAAVELGTRGASKGGIQRTMGLPPERRSEIARNASKARWSGNGAAPADEPGPELKQEPPCNRIPVPATVYRLPSALSVAPAAKNAPSAAPEPAAAGVAAVQAPSEIELAALRAEAAAEDARRNPREREPEPEYPPGFGPNGKWEPDCEQAVELGKNLSGTFTATDLTARLDPDSAGHSGSQRAYLWVSNWKRHLWIESVGYGQYRKTARFGERSKK